MNQFDQYSLAMAKGLRGGTIALLLLAALVLILSFVALAVAAPDGALRNADVASVTSMFPSTGLEGDVVSVICSHVRSAKRIDFSGVEASIASCSSDTPTRELRITVFVPRKARTGLVHVTTDQGQTIDAGLFTLISRSVSNTDSDSDDTARGGSGPGHAFGPSSRPGFPVPPTPFRSMPNSDPGLDLPVEKPTPRAPAVAKAPPAPPPPYPPVDKDPPPQIYGKAIVSKSSSIIYVIDISSSMGWDQGSYTTPDGKTATGNRLDRAKSELTRSILSLPKDFGFNVEAYDCSIRFCFTDYGNSKLPTPTASDENKQKAITWVRALEPQGATGTGPAMEASLNYAENVSYFVLLTDGAPNCGAGSEFSDDPACLEAHRSRIKCANQPGIYGRKERAEIDVFGIGATGSFRQFCLNVASDNGGTYVDVR